MFRLHRGHIAAAIGAGALGIDHIGFTAVPGVAAKPIIDMPVVVVAVNRHSIWLNS